METFYVKKFKILNVSSYYITIYNSLRRISYHFNYIFSFKYDLINEINIPWLQIYIFIFIYGQIFMGNNDTGCTWMLSYCVRKYHSSCESLLIFRILYVETMNKNKVADIYAARVTWRIRRGRIAEVSTVYLKLS